MAWACSSRKRLASASKASRSSWNLPGRGRSVLLRGEDLLAAAELGLPVVEGLVDELDLVAGGHVGALGEELFEDEGRARGRVGGGLEWGPEPRAAGRGRA